MSGRLADCIVEDPEEEDDLLDEVIPYPVDRRVGLTVADIGRIARLLGGEPQPDVDPWTVRYITAGDGSAVRIDGAPVDWRGAHRFAANDLHDHPIDFRAAWATPVRL